MLSTVFFWGVFAVEVFALVDAVVRKNADYEAMSGTLPKKGWLILLGLAVLVTFFMGFSLFFYAGLVAALVYIVQFRGNTV